MTRSRLFLHLAAGLFSGASAFAQPCGIWEVIPSPNPPGAESTIIRDITAITPDDAWAVGDWWGTVDGVVQTYALTLHWDGSSWSLIDTPQPAPCDVCHNVTLWGVDALGTDDVWAAGGQLMQAPDGFVGTHILIMHWDGSEWKVMDTPVQTGASGDLIWRVGALAPDDVWFFGENLYSPERQLGLAIALHWNGSRLEFTDVPIVNFVTSGPTSDNSLHAGSALAPDDMWAVGAGGDGDPLVCDLSQIHHWDGKQWTHFPAQAPDGCYDHSLDAVESISTTDVWAGGETFDGEYRGLALHWNGASWSQVPTPIGIADFVSFGSADVYAFGGGIAHWDGGAWSLVESLPGIVGPSLAGADAAGPCSIWAGGRQLVDGRLVTLTARMTAKESCRPDCNRDGKLNINDFICFQNEWRRRTAYGDFNGDGKWNINDFIAFQAAFGAGC